MSVALAMNNFNSTSERSEDEPRVSLGAIDAKVKKVLETDKDPLLRERGILSIDLTPAHFIFDDQQKLQAKVSLFYTGPATPATRRGIDYATAPDSDGYRREFRYSWDPFTPDNPRHQEVTITYTNDLDDRFSTTYVGFNELDVIAMTEAIELYQGAKNG
jgi:hypothetical protein